MTTALPQRTEDGQRIRQLCTHVLFEARHPDEKQYATDLEQDRRRQWARTHDGQLDGYVQGRERSCSGTLFAVEQGPVPPVYCTHCRFETSMRAFDRPPVRTTDHDRQDF